MLLNSFFVIENVKMKMKNWKKKLNKKNSMRKK